MEDRLAADKKAKASATIIPVSDPTAEEKATREEQLIENLRKR